MPLPSEPAPGEPAALRIAYLTEWSPYEESGVLRKLIGQVGAWRALGADAEIFALATRRDGAPALDYADYGRVIGTFHQRALEKYRFARLGFLNKVASVGKLRRALRAFAPDIIYYRQNGPWYPGIGSLMRLAPTVLELNSNERAEAGLWGRRFARLQGLTRNWLIRRTSGLICMTREIADQEAWAGKPTAVIGNAFWRDPLGDMVPSGNRAPAFVFTGSPMTLDAAANWHGIDKVITLAAAMPEASFHIVGSTAADFAGTPVSANVTFHGVLAQDELTALYRRCDIGIGTLALHRKAMDEACPLKVRDYLIHRMPVIIGYREAQAELEDADYVLQIGNTPDNVTRNLARIADFAAAWTSRRVAADLGFLRPQAVEARRLAVFTTILGNRA